MQRPTEEIKSEIDQIKAAIETDPAPPEVCGYHGAKVRRLVDLYREMAIVLQGNKNG